MKQRKPNFEDRFERKAKALERKEFRDRRESQSYKYIVNIDDDEDFDIASTGVLPFNSNYKRK